MVEGEFGLDKPNMVATKIISAPFWLPPRTYFEERYFPATGKEPGYGRYEIEPPANRKLPPPAQSFHRSWSSQSDPLLAALTSAPNDPLLGNPQPSAANPLGKLLSIVQQLTGGDGLNAPPTIGAANTDAMIKRLNTAFMILFSERAGSLIMDLSPIRNHNPDQSRSSSKAAFDLCCQKTRRLQRRHRRGCSQG